MRTKADRLPPADRPHDQHDQPLWVSVHTGENLDALRHAIARQIGDRGVSVTAEMLALQPRHEHALHAAHDYLAAARELLTPQQNAPQLHHTELIAGEMRSALDELAGLGGRLTPDDVLGRVFATFCIGK